MIQIFFHRCLYDYIDIFTIDSENVKHFENRLCGNKPPEPMISTHQTVELVFKSDYKPAEHKGFKGKYKFLNESKIYIFFSIFLAFI